MIARPLALAVLAASTTVAPLALTATARAQPWSPSRPADPVVVATLDTGTNPFHPCFRRGTERPRPKLLGYPKQAKPLPLSFLNDYESSLRASRPTLQAAKPRTLYFVPGTTLSFYSLAENAGDFLVDTLPHGAQASSQIACEEYGMGSNAHLVILNWYREGPNGAGARLIRWAADQPWIDIIHFNGQDYPIPVPLFKARELSYAISKGKFVIIAAGNGVAGLGANYPMELSRYNGPPGSLVVGANDNGGWIAYSNLNPHVVMDGGATVAAAPAGFGDAEFSGTSSSSPRVAGYVARLLGELRAHFGHTGGGLLTIPAGSPRPSAGPLADGTLTAAELHEVVRKTADPNPHESVYDGSTSPFAVPQPFPLPFAFYPKMGYGEISEKTIDLAFEVLAGAHSLPDQPQEDAFYASSEELRRRLWGD